VVKELFFLFFLLSESLGADSLPPIIINQIKNSSAVLHAFYKGTLFKKNQHGATSIQFSFRIINSLGISEEKLVNKNNFLITSKRDIWRGMIYNSSEKNVFYPGEEVILFLKDGKQGFEILDQEMGKYKILSSNGEVFLKSFESAGNPKLEKINIDEFNELITKKYGKALFVVEKLSLKPKKSLKREVASKPFKKYHDDPFILILFFGILGAIGIKLGRT
jgi:hypothetical protein